MAIIDQAEIHHVYGDFGIITGAHLVPDFLFQFVGGFSLAASTGARGSTLKAESVGILALDPEHISVDDNGVAAA